VRITYIGEIDGEPTISEERTDIRWFTLSEMKALGKSELDIYVKALLDSGAFEEALEKYFESR